MKKSEIVEAINRLPRYAPTFGGGDEETYSEMDGDNQGEWLKRSEVIGLVDRLFRQEKQKKNA